ncbi:BRCT and ankyrin repeats domain containing protein [Echinococcus multilocularis]|uniref:BRCT and ankyrin repeats domain containing protein n=1 Tax=Echinococcus multilocularis TaxID=6211 RepID=A0A068YCS0_ECHMU|nr:BRCT and ankyrin repeats domain containing protein [Echinococcus multilocularis]
MVGFPKTKSSVEKLLDLLRCDNCSRTLHEPFTTGVCSHTLCLECCSTSVAPAGSRSKKHAGISNICPLCYIPIRPCDIKPHPQLHNLVLVARRLAKLLGNKQSTSSGLNIESKDEDPHDSLEFLSSVDYHHFESPSPSLAQKVHLRSLDSSNNSPTVTALSPVECTASPSLQPVVVLTRCIEDVENVVPVESMPPPPAPPVKKSSRRGSVTARKPSEKSAKKSAGATPESKVETRAKAPLASPEQSGMAETLAVSLPIPASPLKRGTSADSSDGGDSEARRSASRCRSKGSSVGGGGEVELRLNSKGESVLHRAAIKNNVSELKRLLTAGLSPNARDHAGWTPLHEAALRGHAEAVECLLTDGHATVDIPGGPDLETALHEAVFNRQVEIVRLLLRHNANPTFANGQGVTPLQMCAQHLSEASQNVLITKKTRKGRRLKRQNSFEALKDIQTIQELLTVATAKISELGKEMTTASDQAASALFIERRRLRPLLLGTGLNRNQKNVMTRVATLIHARVAMTMSAEVTHLITGAQLIAMRGEKQQKKKRKKGEKVLEAAGGEVTCPRTLKFLNAVLQGCWVLSFEWIETCAALKMRVEEEAFEVTGCSTAPNTHASRRARRAREAGSAGLFHGYRFCLLGSFAYPTPDRADLCNLLTCGGANIFSRDVTSPSRLAYIAVDDPVIAEVWMVQQGAGNQELQSGTELLTTAAATIAVDGATTVHPHQLIALYDPRTSGLLTTTSPADETAVAVAAATIVGRPEELVREALRMLQPRSRSSPPTSAVGFRPIILVPATWIMDCIAEYALLPLPTVLK